MNIMFMGTPEISAICLKRLIDDGHNVTSVISREDKPRGRKMIMTPTAVKLLALENNIPVYTPKTLRDEEFTALLEELQDLWKEHRKFLTFSIDTVTLDEIEKTILSLVVAHESGNSYEFEKYRAYLGEAAREISRFERLDLENIL